MKHKKLALVLVALAAGGCAPRGMVRADVLSNVISPVLERHDAYINADGTLTSTENETFLRSSEMVRTVLAESLQPE